MKRVIVNSNFFKADIKLTNRKSISFCRMISRNYKKLVTGEFNNSNCYLQVFIKDVK